MTYYYIYNSEHFLTSEDRIKLRMLINRGDNSRRKGLTFHFKSPLLTGQFGTKKEVLKSRRVRDMAGERWPAPDDLYHDFFDIPGFIAEDLSSRLLKEWYPFNLTGKALTSIYVLKNIKMATWCCLLRLVFYPLFAACLQWTQVAEN
uniref:Uncharacterized protein n=1 Tax=Salix viminalis TaxID=40686 RepID=A0A6N2NG42_SALVM